MVDTTQGRKRMVDHVRRAFEALSADQRQEPAALIMCAQHEAHAIAKADLKHLVDDIFDRGWDGPTTHIASDISQPTNSIDGFKVVVAAEIIGTIQGDAAWCKRYHINKEGLVEKPPPSQ